MKKSASSLLNSSRYYGRGDRLNAALSRLYVLGFLFRSRLFRNTMQKGLHIVIRGGFLYSLIKVMAHKCIAYARNGENLGRITGIRLNLLAFVADSRFDQASISIVAEPPDVGNNLAGSIASIRINSQQMQDSTFYGC